MQRTIQPWVRGMLCASWFLICAQIGETQFEDQFEANFCPRLLECSGVACQEAEYVDRSECTYDAQAAEDCVDGILELDGCESGFPTIPSACDEVYTDCEPCEDDPFYEEMDEVSEGVFGDDGVLCSNVDSDLYDGAITAGNPDWGPWEGGDDHTEFYGVYAFETSFDQDDVDRINRHYPCGASVNAVMGCDSFGNELTPGNYVVIGHVLKGSVPLQDATYTCQYGFVFDRDGDESNNLVAQAPFTGDFFQGTDFWTVLQYTPFVGWFLDVVELRNGIPQPIDELARVIIDENTMTALVPKSSLPAAEPCYRVSVHCHQGDFGETQPSTADTEAPIEEELRCVTAQVGGTGGQGGSGGTGGSGAGEGSGAVGGDDTAGSDDGGGCGCSVSPKSFESSAALSLLVLALLSSHRFRRKRK